MLLIFRFGEFSISSWMFAFNFKKELRVEDEVFDKKKDAEEFLKNKVQEEPKDLSNDIDDKK